MELATLFGLCPWSSAVIYWLYKLCEVFLSISSFYLLIYLGKEAGFFNDYKLLTYYVADSKRFCFQYSKGEIGSKTICQLGGDWVVSFLYFVDYPYTARELLHEPG